MQFFHTLAEFKRDGFDIVVDCTPETMDPWGSLSACFDDRQRLYADIRNYNWDWFMLRTRALLDGQELAATYLGECLYEDAREVLRDGTVEDQLITLLAEARRAAAQLRMRLSTVVDQFPA